jgi:hypothetical protein
MKRLLKRVHLNKNFKNRFKASLIPYSQVEVYAIVSVETMVKSHCEPEGISVRKATLKSPKGFISISAGQILSEPCFSFQTVVLVDLVKARLVRTVFTNNLNCPDGLDLAYVRLLIVNFLKSLTVYCFLRT